VWFWCCYLWRVRNRDRLWNVGLGCARRQLIIYSDMMREIREVVDPQRAHSLNQILPLEKERVNLMFWFRVRIKKMVRINSGECYYTGKGVNYR